MAEVEKKGVSDQEAKTVPPEHTKSSSSFFSVADVVLRFFLFVSSLVAVLVMITSKQTTTILVTVPPFTTPFPVVSTAKYRYSPAFIYFITALSVTGLYSIITTTMRFLALLKHKMPTTLLLLLIIMDVLVLGIVSAATGAAGAIGYLGLKGNSHTNWMKICYGFDKFCKHIGTSVSFSLFASVILVLLVLLNTYALSKKILK
ncbi:dehydrogenase [Lithospermum erythrorhizon]|uniref:CASP-like protein n=1 Tax=Lithospermum erythrorhizon TaxID=34254 RepID=A0AAV3P4V9_LITER